MKVKTVSKLKKEADAYVILRSWPEEELVPARTGTPKQRQPHILIIRAGVYAKCALKPCVKLSVNATVNGIKRTKRWLGRKSDRSIGVIVKSVLQLRNAGGQNTIGLTETACLNKLVNVTLMTKTEPIPASQNCLKRDTNDGDTIYSKIWEGKFVSSVGIQIGEHYRLTMLMAAAVNMLSSLRPTSLITTMSDLTARSSRYYAQTATE